jgi:hypothetical protein
MANLMINSALEEISLNNNMDNIKRNLLKFKVRTAFDLFTKQYATVLYNNITIAVKPLYINIETPEAKYTPMYEVDCFVIP